MSDHPPYSFVQWALPRFHRVVEAAAPLKPAKKLLPAAPATVPAPERMAEPPAAITRLAS
jgi:hypothetical protein